MGKIQLVLVLALVLAVLLITAGMAQAGGPPVRCWPKIASNPNGALVIVACVSQESECPQVVNGSLPEGAEVVCKVGER